ncbi:cytochrome P450 [Gandjariella thermophila]|uniref:Cytochrome P450 n=1 Tax=Gandjariella thermophila TaxID=1931992 RepID=A0A4D4J7V6_9PSEU|nr:cytochrome P450 [Gandjariella thermophila]
MPLYGPRFSQRPGDLYRELRQRYGPVAPVVLEGGVPAWLVLGYREVYHVASNPQQFARDSRRWNAWSEIPDDWPLMPYVGYRPTVLFTEGEEHRRRAGAISDALAAVDQFELTAICERTCDELIDGFAGRGAADLITEYAHRIPVRVVVRLFGMPDADLPALIHDIAVSLDEGEEAVAAHQRTVARMRQLVAGKRQQPGPDVPSRMLAHAAGLSDEEVALDLLMVLASAQQPVANWIGNTLRLMLTDDRFAITLAGGRRSVSEALNEVLWEDTPTQNFIGRWAVRDTRLGGRHIRAGDLLVLGLAAANADPSVRPDSSPGTSGNHAHMSFGHGEHSCPHPAPELAEVIARSAIGVLLDRLPDAALAVGADELRWRPSVWMRGLFSLPVRFTPAG